MHARTAHHFAIVAILLPAFASCASTSVVPRKTLAVDAIAVLKAGERATLPDGSTLRYIAVASDSRCPEKTQCIWAGDADVLFSFVGAGSTPREIHLHTGSEPRSIRAGNHTLHLDSVARGAAPSVTVHLSR